MEATKVKLAGNSTQYLAREMDITRSSKGCLRTSNTVLLYSGNSSKNKTPLWAKDISPGCGTDPPHTRATSEMV